MSSTPAEPQTPSVDCWRPSFWRNGGARARRSGILARIDASSPVESFLCEGSPAEEILATARAWNADLIIIGSHGRTGLARIVMGSVAEQVVRHAPIPVLVVRGPKDVGPSIVGSQPQ
ncbi:MAG TPA: universal stress protein [Candidatus Binatia bacterium]|nr:universal stress protein [Candidatus Binatia bacterium]